MKIFVMLFHAATIMNYAVGGFPTGQIRFSVGGLSPSLSRSRRIFEEKKGRLFGQGKPGMETTTVAPDDQGNNNEQMRTRDTTFTSPLLEYGYPSAVKELEKKELCEKPLLLYLPGFDGTFLSPFLQFPELSTEFEVRCLTVSMQDRSTFDELRQDVLDFISNQLNTTKETNEQTRIDDQKETQNKQNNNNHNVISKNSQDDSAFQNEEKENRSAKKNLFSSIFNNNNNNNNNSVAESASTSSKRPIYLIGESFGGILACDVALSLLDDRQLEPNIKGLVLINPATCYDRCRLKSEGEPVLDSPNLFVYVFRLLNLLNLFLDDYSVQQLLLIFKGAGLPSVIDTPSREAYMGRVAFSLPFVLKFFPQGTFQWRLEQWLSTGCARMEPKLSDFAARHESFRALIIAGEKDLALPSIAEAERLAQILPNSFVHVVDGAGHSSTCGSRLDLTALMRFWFKELQGDNDKKDKKDSSSSTTRPRRRTAMKEVAAAAKDEYFGLEPRYDGKQIGLNPFSYWSKDYYRPVRK